MKILFWTDFSPFEHQGGGALSDHAVIIEGIRRGHEIEVVNSETIITIGVRNFDLLVISNAFKASPDLLVRSSKALPYVMYLHDYFPGCPYHLHYPWAEKCKSCKNLPLVRELLLNSHLNIFLSPLHLQAWSWMIPELKDHPHHLHVSPVDTELFKPMEGVQRIPNSVLTINTLLEFKGLENTLKYMQEHPEKHFTYIGAKDDRIPLPKNVGAYGFVAGSTLPEFYNQAEAFLMLPSNPEPCCRTVIEAKLCGVPKLIINDLVGVASYPEFNLSLDKFREWVAGSSGRFWDKIEGLTCQ